jgi:hypothetical protein
MENALRVKKSLWLFFLLVCACIPSSVEAQGAKKVAHLIPPHQDQPTPVSLGFYLLNLGKINQTEETFDISGLLTTSWRDLRLAFDPKKTGENVRRCAAGQIWIPELTIVNAAALQRRSLIQLSVHPDGTVKCVEFLSVTVSSDFNFRKFPFDSQSAMIIWEPLSYEVQPVTLVGNPAAEGISQDSYVSLSEWEILNVHSEFGERKRNSQSIPRATFEMTLKRHSGFYLFKILLPLSLISIISWTAFWLNPSTSFTSQLNLGITSILAAIMFNLTVTNSLPRVPYTTAMDAFIATCYIFFFISLLATVYVQVLINKQHTDRANMLIRRFRWLFPSLFIIVQGLSFTGFLSIGV